MFAAPLILEIHQTKTVISLILITVAVIFFCSIIGTLGVKERIKPQKRRVYTIKQLFQILGQKPVYITFLVILLYTIGSNIVSAVNTYILLYLCIRNLSWSAILYAGDVHYNFPGDYDRNEVYWKIRKEKDVRNWTCNCRFNAPLMRLIDVRSIPILIISALITGIGSGFAAPLNYGIQADNTDYIEMKMGIRAEGAVASLSSFISKCAMGIGGSNPRIYASGGRI